MTDTNTIVDLQRRIRLHPAVDCVTNLTSVPPPVSQAQITTFESATKLRLPSFVRRLYSEVANGGFGPAYGVVPLIDAEGDTVLDWHRRYRSENQRVPTGPQWPAKLLHFCEGGCATIYALDISVDLAPVYAVEGNQSNDVSDWLTLVSPSVVS